MIPRYITFGVLIVTLVVAGIWFGEDEMLPSHIASALHTDSPVVLLAVIAFAPLATAILGAVILGGKGKVRTAIGACALALALVCGFWFGQRELGRALGECPEAASRIRTRLASYHSHTGHYPASLDELGPVPCQRLLRGSLLWYGRRGDTYDLEFGDWLVGWHATPEGMTVTK